MGNARVIVWETEAAEEWKDLDFRAYPPIAPQHYDSIQSSCRPSPSNPGPQTPRTPLSDKHVNTADSEDAAVASVAFSSVTTPEADSDDMACEEV